MKKLSIIISNRNDTAMLNITVNSCLEELRPLGIENCEIIICDNSDQKIYDHLKSFLPVGYMREDILKVHRQDFPCLFTAREEAIRHAKSPYVVCMDSHMLAGHNMLLDLHTFMENRKHDETLGFAHAPILWSHHHRKHARHDRDMSTNELGDWNTQYNYERTITWKGMPWICKRDWFLNTEIGLNGYGALAQHKLSWGGGDMHIGIKPWLLGYKNWAVPTSPGIHIGPFPDKSHSHKYRLYAASGNGQHCLGFLVSCYILGGEFMIERNKELIKERFGKWLDVDNSINDAIELGKDEKAWLDERKIFTFEQLLKLKPWEIKQ